MKHLRQAFWRVGPPQRRSAKNPGVALKRAFAKGSELPAVAIRVILLADVLADLLQFKPNCGNGITPSPEMLSRKIPFLAAQPGDGYGTLPFQKPDHRSHRVFGRNGHTHMYMVWHQMPFENLAFRLPCQPMENRPQMTARLPEDCFPPPFGYEHHMILAVPFRMG